MSQINCRDYCREMQRLLQRIVETMLENCTDYETMLENCTDYCGDYCRELQRNEEIVVETMVLQSSEAEVICNEQTLCSWVIPTTRIVETMVLQSFEAEVICKITPPLPESPSLTDQLRTIAKTGRLPMHSLYGVATRPITCYDMLLPSQRVVITWHNTTTTNRNKLDRLQVLIPTYTQELGTNNTIEFGPIQNQLL